MKIVIAPDSFKESLSAFEVANYIAKGFQQIYPHERYDLVPVADGGEGTVQALVNGINGRIITLEVTGPLGQSVPAHIGFSKDGKTAIIEMATASGLMLIDECERNPLLTTSYGTGELMLEAAKRGAENMILGVGGSATNDGGAGLLQAIGVRLLDRNNQDIAWGGGALSELCKIDVTQLDPALKKCRITIACDVTNPLIGPEGASAIFGPQKGADEAMIDQLDRNLAHFGELLEDLTGNTIIQYPGSGAGGGICAALLAFLDTHLCSGIDLVMEAVDLENRLKDADLIITGEGRIDSQSVHGKVPIGVAKLAQKYHKPVIGIAGSLSHDVEVVYSHGLDCVFSVILKPCSLKSALDEASINLQTTARNIAQLLDIGRQIGRSCVADVQLSSVEHLS